MYHHDRGSSPPSDTFSIYRHFLRKRSPARNSSSACPTGQPDQPHDRAVATPKLMLTDSGLAAHLTGMSLRRGRHPAAQSARLSRPDLVAREVKAAETVRPEDFRGIQRLARRLGDQLVGGVVLYADGPRPACAIFWGRSSGVRSSRGKLSAAVDRADRGLAS
jgi:hypothetical protein